MPSVNTDCGDVIFTRDTIFHADPVIERPCNIVEYGVVVTSVLRLIMEIE